MRNPARRRTTFVVIAGMVLGGVGAAAYFLVTRPGPATPPPPVPVVAGDGPQEVARAVVARLNARDLDGVIELTCAQGKSTGRRELTKAIPQLDPASPPETRAAPLEFVLGDVREFADGFVADLTVRQDGVSQEGSMRIQRSADKWTLCGMNAPRVVGVG